MSARLSDEMECRPQNGEFEDDQVDYSLGSLAKVINVRLNRRNEHKTWRPLQTSNPSESGHVDNDESSGADAHCNEAGRSQRQTVSVRPSYLGAGSRTHSSTLSFAASARTHLGIARNGTKATESSATPRQDSSDKEDQKRLHYTTVGTHPSVFGNLPDPIRLSEQTGEFDGQVVFIGHPNRDISAHQWSSSSFQWVIIGRYVRSQGKIEGSLASDRPRGIDEPQDTLEYFKLAAENRQMLIVEHGRPKERNATADRRLHIGVGDASSGLHKDALSHDKRQSPARLTLPSIARGVFPKHALEDPFVAAACESVSQPSDNKRVAGNWTASAGSLDLTYRFPIGTVSKPVLKEIAFGEEAATHQGNSSTNNESFLKLRTSTAYELFHERTQFTGKNEESRPPALPTHNSLKSCVRILETAVRHPLSTRPLISASSTTSALNAAAMPYPRRTTTVGASGALEHNVSLVNTASVGLRRSDPNRARFSPPQEVANGLDHQVPTPQTFEGPFFTDSKPTTHDPTVALSVRVSEQEKLENWFSDGHRPARQNEYTKSLMAAAMVNDVRYLGVVGEVSAQGKGGPYANTAPFVRLYENLSEYAEEYRNGSGRSYFTRGWKPASAQLRDMGVDHSTGYFSKGNARPCWPKMPVFRPSERPMWG